MIARPIIRELPTEEDETHMTPEEIDFDDIRVGDTIEVVDTWRLTVEHKTAACIGDLIRGCVTESPLLDRRTFRLISRPVPPVPPMGTLWKDQRDGMVWVRLGARRYAEPGALYAIDGKHQGDLVRWPELAEHVVPWTPGDERA